MDVWRERLALVLVYGALPVIALVAAADSAVWQHVAQAVVSVYGLTGFYLLATSGGRSAYARAFQHQQATIGSWFWRRKQP